MGDTISRSKTAMYIADLQLAHAPEHVNLST